MVGPNVDLNAASLQLGRLLATPEEQFVVPLYQRPYSWTSEEVDELWEDITYDLAAEHFLGSIVINDERSSQPQIIDGQQRLISLVVILGLIRDEYFAIDSPYADRPQRLLVADDWADPLTGRYKIRAGEANWPVIRDFVLRPMDDPQRRTWSDRASLSRKAQSDNAELFSNAMRLSELLQSHLKPVGESQQERERMLVELEQKITKRLTFVAIRVGSVDDAFLLFETLNDRGLRLSAADLVKSHLLARFEQVHGKAAVADAADSWSDVLESLKRAEIGRFLRYFLLQDYEKVQTDRVFRYFKERLAQSSPNAMLDRLSTMAEHYGQFLRPGTLPPGPVQAALNDLSDLRVPTCYVALLPAREVLASDMLRFARFVRIAEALAYRWTVIVGKNAQALESVFQRAAAALVAGGARAVSAAERILLDAMPSRQEFVGAFRTKRMGTQYVARYTLRRIEEFLSEGSEIKPPAKVQIEHIMPQHLSDPWKAVLGASADDVHSDYVRRWGNLTLLSAKLNKAARDGPFDDKVRIYSSPDGPGSDIRMTQMLARETGWGPQAIDARQQWMAMMADQVWSIQGIDAPESVVVPEYPWVDVAGEETAIRTLIEKGESGTVEFKQTARVSTYTGELDKGVEGAVAKTVAGFSNAVGGSLILGVTDSGEVYGLESDYPFVKNQSRDGIKLWLIDLVKTRIDPVLASTIAIEIIELDGHDVAHVRVPQGMQPVFMKDTGDTQRFYVRATSATNELSGTSLLNYLAQHWPDHRQ